MPLPLASWQNFYVLIGSAAGALTGLQFIVIALIAQSGASLDLRDVRAFGTPTVVHFTAALVISAVMAAPWQSPAALGACLLACGGAGTLYSLTIIRHARKAAYNPDLEDWIWYTALPLVAHLTLLAAALLFPWNAGWGECTVAAAALLLLLLGIHNSWDTVTHTAIHLRRTPRPDDPESERSRTRSAEN
jgi:hypothetical protein